MHVTRSTDDLEFREAAKAVVVRAEDLVPVEGQPGMWRLPLKQRPALMTPAMKRLFFLVRTKKLSAIFQRRPGKRITLARGPDILLLSKETPPVEENQFILSIGLEKPFAPQKAASSTLKKPKKAERATDDIASTTTKEPRESPILWETLIAVLRQEAEITITASTLTDCSDKSIGFGDGDMLELDAPESLRPKTGCVFGMVIVFDCRDILEGDQDIEKEGAPSAVSSVNPE
ncbi:hypothetical protein MMC13_005132 [Lambiella insularis]|nr:hypothetical protein [Lambiella insularis]